MKYIRAVVLIGMLVALTISWAQTPGASEQALLKAEKDWMEAVIKSDAATLQRLFADEYLSTDPGGVTWNKSQNIESITSGTFKVASSKFDDMKVRVYGQTAVVTGLNVIKATIQGKDVSGPYRFTDVFVKRGGRWQCVATQATLVAKK